VLAIVSETPLPAEALPVLMRANVPVIADFILDAVGLPRRGSSVGAPSGATNIDRA
jgi:hypothetical protein